MSDDPNALRPSSMKLNVSKAGLEGVDVDRVNEIILSASRGSNFFLHQQQRQKQIEAKIGEMRAQLSKYTEEDIQNATKLVDLEADKLESRRDLDHVIVHIDMDAFYAAVEIRDNPTLKDVPMAVGGQSMLSTSNYIARKFGVRAAMPGFIAKKLCPQLIIVEPNFDKYIAVSNSVKTILAEYDPDFCSMSLDEAGLDLTNLTNEKHRSLKDSTRTRDEVAQEIVHEIRNKVFEKTSLTCSAGIACNTRLAKVCSNMKKPDGQFYLPSTTEAIKEFMKSLPVGKVCGIGNVTQQELMALGVKTCGDLWEQRGLLSLLFSKISASTFLRISMGLGSLLVKCDDPRKSMSVERTFKDTSDRNELINWCKELSKALSEDLKGDGTVGKLITLKMKTTTFQTKTRAKPLTKYTSNEDAIYTVAQQLLEQEIKCVAPEILKLRLMGVRMSNLLSESEKPAMQQQTLEDAMANLGHRVATRTQQPEELIRCPICNEVDLRPEQISAHVEKCLDTGALSPDGAGCGGNAQGLDMGALSADGTGCRENVQASGSGCSEIDKRWTCPVCNTTRTDKEPDSMNKHIDDCLSKREVRQVLREDRDREATRGTKRPSVSKRGSKVSAKMCKLSSPGVSTIKTFLVRKGS